jgi:hypothetical protein
MQGRDLKDEATRRTWIDWSFIAVATMIFVILGVLARVPHLEIEGSWLAVLSGAMLFVLVACGVALWRVTRFI